MPVYLKYGTIKGDVTEPAYRGWIELNSAQLGTHSAQYGGEPNAAAPPGTRPTRST